MIFNGYEKMNASKKMTALSGKFCVTERCTVRISARLFEMNFYGYLNTDIPARCAAPNILVLVRRGRGQTPESQTIDRSFAEKDYTIPKKPLN
mmetsp:Transcript_55090/g.112645  ORF Transcript_55090/g.112645 Transcript_55090/m.112645 type:complete len:93 (+) Transcript_55090:70-348(+)